MSNSPARVAYALLHLWLLRCNRLSYRSLQRLLGFLQWLHAPSSFYAPFLASAYQLLHKDRLPTLLPRNVWCSLLVACLGAALPLKGRPLPPPLCMPLMFCDAAPSSEGFLAACIRPCSFAVAVPTPPWIQSQQAAELYAVFSCIRQAAIHRLSHVCVVVDNEAAYHTVKSGKASGRHWERVRLLRRINRMCVTHHIHVELALTPSASNAADVFSRFHDHHPDSCPVLALPHVLNPNLRRPSTAHAILVDGG